MSFEDNVNVGKDNEFEDRRKTNNSNSETNNLIDEKLEDIGKNNTKSDEKQAEKNEKIREKTVKKQEDERKKRIEELRNLGEDEETDKGSLATGRKGLILNPKFRRIFFILLALFLVALILLLFSNLFSSNDEETKVEQTVEDVVKEETLSNDDLKQMQENSSGINGQETSFAQMQENNGYENPSDSLYGTRPAGNLEENQEGQDNYQDDMSDIEAKEQESLKALEEMENQLKSDSYDTNYNDGDYQTIEKPRKNRNTIKIEDSSPIGIYRGAMNDKIQYVEAKLQKESALNQMGVNTKGKGNRNNNGTSGRVGGGIDINYQANETDKVAAEMFGTDPSGVQVNGRVGGSAGARTRANRTPYYAYEKEEGMYDIFEGTIIPAVITNEINSDYPGRVTAIVREDVYDSLTGNFLLIPKGSKIMGDMIPINANGGVEKVATVWDRIILTNGDNIFMDNFRGQDLSGIDGIEGKVNKRYLKKISSIVASSVFEGTIGILSTLPEILLRKHDKRDGVVYSESGGRAGDRMGQSLTQIVDNEVQKVVTRPNTVTIKSGTKTNIVVNVDIRLPKFERERVTVSQ